jgi:glutamate/tyrosine decarboxylase-like PLP-dependent enzyme
VADRALGPARGASFGFVTGAQMANFTALAAARHRVLEAAGWDVDAEGLVGALQVQVVVGEERHVTIDRALRFLGFGTNGLVVVLADGQGRMRPDALRDSSSGVRRGIPRAYNRVRAGWQCGHRRVRPSGRRLRRLQSRGREPPR